jgi:hypothetical protein
MKARLINILALAITISAASQQLWAMPMTGQTPQAAAPITVTPGAVTAATTPTQPLGTVPAVQSMKPANGVAQAITPAPLPAAPKAPITTTPQPAKPTAPPAIVTAAPVASPAPQNNAAHFKELEGSLRQIEQTKQSLTTLLKELDDKLLDARKKAAEAKTLNTNLLSKQQESEAKADYEKIRDANKSVQTTQEFVQADFSKNFNDKIAEFRVQTTKAEGILKTINAQKTQPTKTLAITSPLPVAAPAPQAPATAPAPSGFFNAITSGIASVVSGVTNFFSDHDAPKKKTEPVVENTPIPANPTQRASEATTMVKQMDQHLQALDATRNTIQQYITTISQNSEYIETLAKQGGETSQLLSASKKATIKVVEPGWKNVSMKIVSKILDGIGFVVAGIYKLYDVTIGSFSRNLIKDVKAKIAANEAPKTKPGAA